MPRASRGAVLLALAVGACAHAPTPPAPKSAGGGPVPAATTTGTARAITLANPGFESTEAGVLGAPAGWFAFQHAGAPSYTFTLDTSVAYSGANSLRIDNVGPEVYGAVAQRIPAGAYRGATLHYSVWMRTRQVAGGGLVGGAGPTLQAFRGGSPAASADGTSTLLVGTNGWTRRQLTLAIPPAADTIEIGVVLGGPGTVWADDAELMVVAGR